MKADLAKKVCQECKAACCKICGSDFTESEMKKVLRSGSSNFFTKVNKSHYESKTKDTVCPYLTEENLCSVHKSRPLMCKCWPIYPECKNNREGRKYFLIECALTPLLSKKDIHVMKRQASSIAKELLISSSKNSKLPRSELRPGWKKFSKFKKNILK